MEASIGFRTALVITVVASPFLGCFAATFVRARLLEESILLGRSRCAHCGRTLEWPDLIPLFSWLINYGECRHCSAPIPLFYPSVEFAFLGAALAAAQLEPTLIVPGFILGWALIILCVFDLTAFVLPNFLTYSLLACGLGFSISGGGDALLESLAAASIGGGSLLIVRFAYRLVRGREGLGMGDVKLFAAAGAWVGVDGLPQTLLVGSLLGLVYARTHLTASKNIALERVPFGAGLCVALWFTWYFGSFLL